MKFCRNFADNLENVWNFEISEIFEFSRENSYFERIRMVRMVRMVRSLADRTFQLWSSPPSVFSSVACPRSSSSSMLPSPTTASWAVYLDKVRLDGEGGSRTRVERIRFSDETWGFRSRKYRGREYGITQKCAAGRVEKRQRKMQASSDRSKREEFPLVAVSCHSSFGSIRFL